MFKKIKDKLEEEFTKQGQFKLPSVQQLAQVISPSPSNSSLSSESHAVPQQLPVTYPGNLSNVSSDCFSIGDDENNDTSLPQLHNIDLTATSPSNMTQGRSRRSSLSSVTSEASSLCPIYETQLNHLIGLQSDFESELEDGMTSQLEKITKEKLYYSYKQIVSRYNKYKGRYMDLSKQYKDLQHDNVKTKNVLQESQDKALRRIAELREQCQLEQTAKAHLEESLRNDVEERDHVIATLRTKINLLKGSREELSKDTNDNMPLVDLLSTPEETELSQHTSLQSVLQEENEKLKKEVDNLKRFNDETTDTSNADNLKEKITGLKMEISKMKSENETLSHLVSKTERTTNQASIEEATVDSVQSDEKDKKIEKLNNLLLKCKEKIAVQTTELKQKTSLISEIEGQLKVKSGELKKSKEEIDNMKLREEESVLTVAENKMAIHSELEAKEAHIRRITAEMEEIRTRVAEHKKQMEDREERIRAIKDESDRDNKAGSTEISQLKDEVMELEKKLAATEGEVRERNETSEKLISFITEQGTTLQTFTASKEEQMNAASEAVKKKLERLERKMLDVIQLTQHNGTGKNNMDKALIDKNNTISKLEEEIKNKSLESLTIQGTVKNQQFEIETLKSENSKQMEDKNVKICSLETECANLRTAVYEEQSVAKKTILDLEELTKLNKELNERYSGCEADLEKYREDLEICKSVKTRVLQVEAELQTMTREKLKLEERGTDFQTSISALEKELEEVRTALEKKEAEFEIERKQMSSNQVLETSVIALEEKLASLGSEKKELENMYLSELEKLNRELEEKMQDCISLAKSKDNFELDVVNLTKELEKSRVNISELGAVKSELSHTTDAFQQVKNQLNKETQLKKQMNDENDKMKSDMVILQSTCDDLEAKYSDIAMQLEKAELLQNQNSIETKTRTEETQNMRNEIELLQNILKGLMDNEVKLDHERSQFSKLTEVKVQRQLVDVETEKENLEKVLSETTENYEQLQKDVIAAESKRNSMEICLREATQNFEKIQKELADVVSEKASLQSAVNEATQNFEKIQKELADVVSEKASLQSAVNEATQNFEKIQKELADVVSEKASLQSAVSESHQQFIGLEKELKTSQEKIEDMKVCKQCDEHDILVNKLKENIDSLKGWNNEVVEQMEWKTQEIETLKTNLNIATKELNLKIKEYETERRQLTEENEGKLNVLKNEIKFLNEKYKDDLGDVERNRVTESESMQDQLKHSEKMAAELLEKLEIIQGERDELKLQLEDKGLKMSELESCMSELKTQLDEKFHQDLTVNSFSDEVKQVIGKYEVEVAKRDEIIQSLEAQLIDFSDLKDNLKMCREDSKGMRKEIVKKDNLIEDKCEQLIRVEQEYENKILNDRIDSAELIEKEKGNYEEKLKYQKTEFDKILKNQKLDYEKEIERVRKEREECEEEQRAMCDRKLLEVQEKHKLETMTSSTSVVSDSINGGEDSPVAAELAVTSHAAVKAVESGAGSLELLQKQFIQQTADMKELKKQHKREIIELKKLIGLGKSKKSRRNSDSPEWCAGGIENDTEHEYLRNILYEYMMGREQMVLAKVLSAIVKFDQQQTLNVMEKEQHRQTLLGQLGIR